MDGKAFNKLLASNITGPWCICSSDFGLRDIYFQKLQKALNPDKIVYIRSLETFKPLGKLLRQKILYVFVSDSTNEKLFDFDLNIVQLSSKLDARTSFVKKHTDRIIELKPLKEQELKDWIKKNSDLTEEQIDSLIKNCNDYHEYNFAKIRNELTKYKLSGLDWNEFNKQSYDHAKDGVFLLCESLIRGDKDASVYYLDHCKRVNEASMIVLTVLSNNCKQILQVQNCPNPTSQNTGISNPYVIMQTKKLCGLRENEWLTKIIKLCNELDLAIKTGQIDDEFVKDYLVAKVLTI